MNNLEEIRAATKRAKRLMFLCAAVGAAALAVLAWSVSSSVNEFEAGRKACRQEALASCSAEHLSETDCVSRVDLRCPLF